MAIANTKIARPYAKAIFERAEAGQNLEYWSSCLSLLAQFSLDPAVKKLIADPLLADERKAEFFIELCGKKLNSDGHNFLLLLASNKRLGVLPEIKLIYDRLLAEKERIEKVTVTSAAPLDKAARQALVVALESRLNGKVEANWQEDPRILGGAIIHTASGLVIDGSIRGQLTKLTRQLVAA